MVNKLIVIKLGTSSIVDEQTGFLALPRVALVVDTICRLRRDGFLVVLVSSGSIGAGRKRLGVTAEPSTTSVAQKQAYAAVGQGRLMSQYDDLFGQYNQVVAQILLTRPDLAERSRFANVRNTFTELLALGVVPIVNENDSVSVDGVKFGDNDTLSALVAGMLGAAWLFLLTDVDSLKTANPKVDPTAERIAVVSAQQNQTDGQFDTGGRSSSGLGTGGMQTKLLAARLVSQAGGQCCVLSAETPQAIYRIVAGHRDVGTVFEAAASPMRERKWWILYSLHVQGRLLVDDGAADALWHRHGLHAVGVRAIQGVFSALSCVQVVRASDGRLVGRGLTDYSSAELGYIRGHGSEVAGQLLAKNSAAAAPAEDAVPAAAPPSRSVISYRNFVVENAQGDAVSASVPRLPTANPARGYSRRKGARSSDTSKNIRANGDASSIAGVSDAYARASRLLAEHGCATRGFLPARSCECAFTRTAFRPFDRFVELDGGLAGGPVTNRLLAELPDRAGHTTAAAVAALASSELERAMTVLTYIAAALVWGDHSQVQSATNPPSHEGTGFACDRLPASVAVPLMAVARRLDRHPMVSHATSALFNWHRRDPTRPVCASNVDIACLWNRGGPAEQTERWFFATAVEVEQHFAEGLIHLLRAHELAQEQPVSDVVFEALISELGDGLAPALDDMTAALDRVKEHCDPALFYRHVRPYVTGYRPSQEQPHEGQEELQGSSPPGVWFETGPGADDPPAGPFQFAGGSAGQSVSFHLLDRVLGISHPPELAAFFDAQAPYAPVEHRDLMSRVSPASPLRRLMEDAAARGEGRAARLAVAAFNQCVDALKRFRSVHLSVAVRYIVQQADKPDSADSRGTGGTRLVTFLKRARDDCTLIKEDDD